MTISRVVGPPGCGKTTYLSRQVHLAYEAGHQVMVCSLTRTAAAEVAGRDLPISKDAIGTLHSHAYRALGQGKINIADDPKHMSEWNEAHPNLLLSGGRILDEDNSAPSFGPTEADQAYADYNNHRARLIMRENWQQSTLHFAKAWEHWKHEQLLLDFTDLLETALQTTETAPNSPGVIFADEAQDFSALEMALLQHWGTSAGRLVVTGDPWQALYNWRGADAGVVFPPGQQPDRVLNQSYRVPQAVHATAMCWIEKMPGFEPIEYQPTDIHGQVSPCSVTADHPERAADIIERALSDNKTVMYLASCARMLRPMLAVLRKRGVPFHNAYRRAEGAWNPLQTRRIGATYTVSAAQRLAAFLRLGAEGIWTKDDVRRWGAAVKGSETFADSQSWKRLEPLINNIPDGPVDLYLWETLLGNASVDASMSQDLDWWLEHLLASRRDSAQYPVNIARARGREALVTEPTVTVGTIHSVKGGEADVVIIAPDVSVPGAAEWAASDAGKASIYRLFYVALTRAKEEVHIMQPVKPSMAVRLI